MNQSPCPYCGGDALITTIRLLPSGFEVSGKCYLCGYTCDSQNNRTELADDLLGDLTYPLDVVVD